MPAHHVPDEALLAYAAGAASGGEELLVACHLTLCPACRARVEEAERVGQGLLARAEPVAPPGHLLAAVLARLDEPDPAGPAPAPARERPGSAAAPPGSADPAASILDGPGAWDGARPVAECPVFPLPLRRRVGALASLPWRSVGLDVRAARVEVEGFGGAVGATTLHGGSRSVLGLRPAGSVPSIGAPASEPSPARGKGTQQRVFLLDFPPGFRIPTHGHHGAERALVLRGGFDDERDTFVRGDVSWREDPGHDVRIHPDARCTTLFVNDGAAELGWLTPLVDWWLHR